MFKKRCVIHTHDVQRITGLSKRYGQHILRKIRDFFGKESRQFVTVEEFSKFTGLPIEEIERYLD